MAEPNRADEPDLAATQAQVQEFYRSEVKRETRRLTHDAFHRLEFETTLYFLSKYLPPTGLVLDAGGGPGTYAVELGRRGYDVALLDLTPELLTVARRRAGRARVRRRLVDAVEGTITDLSHFPDRHFDAVLCLGGPLSHVAGEEQRRHAVRELARVAKDGAPIAVSVMGRLAVIADTVRFWPDSIEAQGARDLFTEVWREGEDHLFCGKSYAHFFLPDEFLDLLRAGGIDLVEAVGLEGLGSHAQPEINALARRPGAWKRWIECHLALCTHPAVFATSGHMLAIGRRA